MEMHQSMNAEEVALRLEQTIEMIEALEDFVGLDLSKSRELARIVLEAYRGNPVDRLSIEALTANRHSKPKEQNHGNVLRVLRLVPPYSPPRQTVPPEPERD